MVIYGYVAFDLLQKTEKKISVSLQTFWQDFHRNIPLQLLSKHHYLFGCYDISYAAWSDSNASEL